MPRRSGDGPSSHRSQRSAWLDLTEHNEDQINNPHPLDSDDENDRTTTHTSPLRTEAQHYDTVVATPRGEGRVQFIREARQPRNRSGRYPEASSSRSANTSYSTVNATPRQIGSTRSIHGHTEALGVQPQGTGNRMSRLLPRANDHTTSNAMRRGAIRPRLNIGVTATGTRGSRPQNGAIRDAVTSPRSPPQRHSHHGSHDVGSDCNICTYPIGQAREDLSVELGITLPCSHFFGHICLAQALSSGSRCPLCRRNIVGENRRFLLGGVPQEGTTTGDQNTNRRRPEDGIGLLPPMRLVGQPLSEMAGIDRFVEDLGLYGIRANTLPRRSRHDDGDHHDAISPRNTMGLLDERIRDSSDHESRREDPPDERPRVTGFDLEILENDMVAYLRRQRQQQRQSPRPNLPTLSDLPARLREAAVELGDEEAVAALFANMWSIIDQGFNSRVPRSDDPNVFFDENEVRRYLRLPLPRGRQVHNRHHQGTGRGDYEDDEEEA